MIRFIGYVFILAVSVSAFAAGLLIASAIFHEWRQHQQLKALWRAIFKKRPDIKPPGLHPMCRCALDPEPTLKPVEVPDHPVPPTPCEHLLSLEELATVNRKSAEEKLRKVMPYWQSKVGRELVRRARRRELSDPVFTGTIEEVIRSSQREES